MPTRRAFLRSGAAFAVAGPHRFTGRHLRDELRILQWAHPTPGYDAWADARAARWGEAHDARVTIDHVNSGDLGARARAEVATKHGHDLVQLLAPPTGLQTETVDVADAVAEVTRRLGPPARAAAGAAHNPRTGRWFAFPDHFVPLLAIRRTDLVPHAPTTWPAVLRIAPALRRRRHPVAIGLAGELDSNVANISMLLAHGGRLDRLDSAGTRAYLRTMSELYRRGLPREVVDWNASSNDLYLAGGRGSLILDPVNALAGTRLPVAASPAPGARSTPHTTGSYVLWSFSPNRELAQRFLVDQQLGYRAHFVRSGHVNVPAWPGAAPDLRALQPVVAAAAARTVDTGYPGPTNGAVQELAESFAIPTAARAVAQGTMSVDDAVARLDAQAKEIEQRWREAKLI